MRYKDYEGPVEVLVNQKLDEIEEKEHVFILHAVESGSRAWGFASPDSDYDVRFIYVREPKEYLKLQQARDVIEWELDETLDINGWDLQKALRQYHRSNATLFEWANSPVVYRTTKMWKEIHEKASPYFAVKSSLYHYYGTAKKNYLEYLTGEEVNYKKYFYVIRPILACKWIEERKCPPPVLFSELLEAELPEPREGTCISGDIQDSAYKSGEIRAAVEQLLEIKARMPESGCGPRVDVLNHFIEAEIVHFKEMTDHLPDDRKEEWEPLNEIFYRLCFGGLADTEEERKNS